MAGTLPPKHTAWLLFSPDNSRRSGTDASRSSLTHAQRTKGEIRASAPQRLRPPVTAQEVIETRRRLDAMPPPDAFARQFGGTGGLASFGGSGYGSPDSTMRGARRSPNASPSASPDNSRRGDRTPATSAATPIASLSSTLPVYSESPASFGGGMVPQRRLAL